MFEHGFPKHWSTLKKLIYLKGAGIIGGASAVWKTVTGTLIHITDALASPVKELSVAIEPQQSGSGDPSPTNIRPITGATGCGINCAGADLYDHTYEKTGYLQANGDRKTSSSWAITYYIEVSTGNYVAKGLSLSGSGTYICVYDSGQTFLRSVEITANAPVYFTIANGEKYIRMSVRTGSSEYETAQLLKYDIHTISWQTEAGTVYGGTLTVNEDGSGTLIKKYKMLYGGNQSWKKVSSNYFRNFTFAWETAAQDNDIATVWSSNYKGVASNNGATQDGDSYVWMRAAQSGSDQLCCVKDTSKASMTAAEFKSAMSGVQFLALLKEEEWTTYTLTAQQISTLAGENNIWADANGEITLTYQAVSETAFSDNADTGMADFMTLTE